MLTAPACALLITSTTLAAGSAMGGGIPDYDFQWATISDPGNPGYFGPGDFNMSILGRGDVDYEYRMSKNEVSTAQWIEFINTFAADDAQFANDHAFFSSWGAGFDPEYDGPGRRFVLRTDIADAGRMPVSGMSFRTAALYVNWLHNGKPSDLQSIQSGAYDASTFGDAPGGGFSDQVVRSPGAKFWIPNASEWKKAVFWDPNKEGPGQGGWWTHQYSSDTAPAPGFPGEPGAQTSAGIDWPAQAAMSIPLNSYDAASPWGLFDTSGGESEMLEGWFELGPPYYSMAYAGADGGSLSPSTRIDQITGFGTMTGGDRSGLSTVGLRIASAVPNPSSVFVLCGGTTLICQRRRRTTPSR